MAQTITPERTIQQEINLLLDAFPGQIVTVRRTEDGQIEVGALNWFDVCDDDYLQLPVTVSAEQGELG